LVCSIVHTYTYLHIYLFDEHTILTTQTQMGIKVMVTILDNQIFGERGYFHEKQKSNSHISVKNCNFSVFKYF
jgi:hypothetical protein